MIGKLKKGFTLIELLIVIAIIGILTVAFLPTLRGGQAAARDAARKAAVNSIVVAISLLSEGQVTGVTAKIPVTLKGECLDAGSAGNAQTISKAMGKAINIQPTGVVLCDGGYYYRTFKSDGGPTAAATDTAANYVIAAQVEKDANANVTTVFAATDFDNANAADATAVDTKFTTFDAARGSTIGAANANAPFVYAATK